MKDIKFEVSDEIYWQFVAQVDIGYRVSIPGGGRRRVLVQVEDRVWNKVCKAAAAEVWNELGVQS